jgi:serine/threonine-protein phosphatase 5
MCHIQILKPQLAIADLKKVLALEPQNAQVRQELDSTQKLVRKIEFEKAIEVEEEKSAAERCLEIIAEGAPRTLLSSCFNSNSDLPKVPAR